MSSSIENTVLDSELLSTVEVEVVEEAVRSETEVCRPRTLEEWLSPDPATTSVVEAVIGESLESPPRTALEVLQARGIELVPREELTPVMLEHRLQRMIETLRTLRIDLAWHVHLAPAELYEKLYMMLVIERLGLPSADIRWKLDMIDVNHSGDLRIWMEFYAPGFDDNSGSSDLGCV